MSESIGYVEVTVKNAAGETVTKSFDFGNDLEDMVARWGKEVVEENAVIGMKTALRNRLYSLLNGKTPVSTDEALLKLENWRPDMPATRERAEKDPLAKAKAKFANLSPEDRQKLIAELQAMCAQG